MNRRGFTLLEVIAVLAVVAIILTIAVPRYGVQLKKVAIERQTKELHFDLLAARANAVTQRSAKNVTVTPTSVTVDGAVKQLPYRITWSGRAPGDLQTQLVFDEQGTYNLAANQDFALCVQPSLPDAQVDSIVIYGAGSRMGKLSDGGACASANITVQ